MNPIISIVIPVYNVEQYLRKCLDSCINQTLKEIEIIVVDDCSPDNSDKIMLEYERKYPDIVKCIYLDKNIKLGGARNKGVEIANGEYILFVDSDDYIANNMCEELYKSITSNNADMVICDYFRVIDERLVYRKPFNPKINSVPNIKKQLLLEWHLSGFAWNRLTKRELIKKYLFAENCYYEDLPVTLLWVLNAKKINYIAKPLYYYLYRNNSIVCELNYSNAIQNARAIVQLIENFKNEKIFEDYYTEFSRYILEELFVFLSGYAMRFIEYGSKGIDFLRLYVKSIIFDWKEIFILDLPVEYKNLVYNYLEYDNYLERLLEKEHYSKYRDKQLAVWGYGSFGKQFLSFLKKIEIIPKYIVDSDKNIQGTYVEDILITDFESIKNDCDIVIVAIKNKEIFNQIKKQIKDVNSNIEVKYFTELFIVN